VGLNGEIRSVSQVGKRLSEAKRLGLSRAIGPKLGTASGVQGVATVAEAVRLLHPDRSPIINRRDS
jgi:predicted ATP-dependent serine protease